MRSKYKVLVVDDSSIMRLLVSDILQEDKDIEVVGVANNGKEAVDYALKESLDVLVMDVHMGTYSGVYAVRNIMEKKPTPIILLSAVGNTDMSPIIEALNLGAFDYVNKPARNSTKIRDVQDELLKKVKEAAVTDVNKLLQNDRKNNFQPHTFLKELPYDVMVIGSSTGGPSAVEKVISTLPSNFAIPVLIAQHMPANFIPSFAKRLNNISPLKVVVGAFGQTLEPRTVYIAPGEKNMIVRRKSDSGEPEIGFTNKEYKEFNNPSVDALMLSVASVFKEKTIGVILTGMGRDGSVGMEAIKKNKGFTVAQDKDTAVVFGMPKEAIQRGAVDHVLPVHQIGEFIVSSLS